MITHQSLKILLHIFLFQLSRAEMSMSRIICCKNKFYITEFRKYKLIVKNQQNNQSDQILLFEQDFFKIQSQKFIIILVSIKNCKIIFKCFKLEMTNQYRNLPSLYSKIQWDKLTYHQKTKSINQIKTKAALLIIQANQYITNKNFTMAKQLVIYIADLCMQIKEPDEQVEKWMQITCSYIALIYRSEELKLKSQEKINKKKKQNQNLLSLQYNKFSSQFELKLEDDQSQLSGINTYQDVLHYVTKINSILFGYQNVGSRSPLSVMFFSYWFPFLFSILILVLIFIYLVSQNFLDQLDSTDIEIQIPLILLGSLFIIPMILIIIKTPEQKNNLFFSKKLVQQIRHINLDCKKRGKKIEFFLSFNGQKIYAKLGKNEPHAQENMRSSNGGQNQQQFMGKIEQLKNQISKASGKSIYNLQNDQQQGSRSEFLQSAQK